MANPKHLSKLKEGAGTLVRALGQLLQDLRSVAGNIRVKPIMVMPGHMARFQTPVRVWDRERRLGPKFVPGHTIATFHRNRPRPVCEEGGIQNEADRKRSASTQAHLA
jgi:hypothetical protein